jgi:hypothetical protein
MDPVKITEIVQYVGAEGFQISPDLLDQAGLGNEDEVVIEVLSDRLIIRSRNPEEWESPSPQELEEHLRHMAEREGDFRSD